MTALMGLATRLRLSRLYLDTDARRQQGDLADFLDAAFRGGVDIVALRNEDLDPDEELAALEVARTVAQRHQGLVCVSHSAELAGRFRADVLHLGQADGSSRAARRHLHEWALVGRSTHEPKQTRQAVEDQRTDYFCVGPVYASATGPAHAPVGLDLVRSAAELAPPAQVSAKPWFAGGGITGDNLADVLGAGARRICVARSIASASDPEAAARALSDRLREAWRADPEMQKYALTALG